MLGYNDVKSRSYTHLYLPGLGAFTNAPNKSTCFISSCLGLLGATVPSRFIYVNAAPSKYLVGNKKSSYGTCPLWHIPRARSISFIF